MKPNKQPYIEECTKCKRRRIYRKTDMLFNNSHNGEELIRGYWELSKKNTECEFHLWKKARALK
jgi:hypothetical protein